MKNITGVNSISTTNSTGTLSFSNASENMELSFNGGNTNNITTTGTNLSATSDVLTINLNSATSSTVAVDAGFESILVNTTGTGNVVTSITSVGAAAATIAGSGTTTVADNAMTSVNAWTVTDTAAVKFGTITTKDVKSLIATSNTDGILSATTEAATTATATAGQATVASKIELDTNGATIMLGSGNDNLYIVDQAVANKSNTIKTAAGDDSLVFSNSTGGNSYIFTEAGDDAITLTGTAFAATDLINMGEGTDTLRVTNNVANDFVLRDVENVVMSNGAGKTATKFSNVDEALNISVEVATADDAINLAGSALLNGSSLTATATAAAAKNAAGDTTVNFKANEAATTTIAFENGHTGSLTTTNIANLTVTHGAASNMADAINLDKVATDLTLTTSKGALTVTDIANVASESLANFTVTAADAFTMGDILNSDKMQAVSATAAKNLTIDDMTAAAALNTYSATSTAGAVNIGKIADTAPAVENTINSITVKGATTATLDNVGETTKTNIGTVSVTGVDAVDVNDIAAKSLTSVAITSDKSTLTLGTAAAAITAADTDGYSVSLSADTSILSGTGGATAAIIKNTAGDITTATLSVAGTYTTVATSYVDFTLATADNTGSLTTLNATAVKGGLTTVITNDELKTIGTTTVNLGAKDASTVNSVTLAGYVGKVTVNGSAGKDTIVDKGQGIDAAAANTVNSSDIFAAGNGVDTISYTTHTSTNDASNGMAINLSSSTVTFGSGSANETTLAANTAAEYDATYYLGSTTSTEKAIVLNGELDTITGFENVTDSAKDDAIYLGAAAGTIISTGGDDRYTGGDSGDTFTMSTFLTSADVIDGAGGSDTLTYTDQGATTDLDHVTNVETVTLGDAITAVTLVAGFGADGESRTFDGAAMDTAGSGLTLNTTASAADYTIDLSGADETTAVNIDTGAGDDVVKVKVGAGTNDINTGAGNDQIQGGTAVDTILAGDGADIIDGGDAIDKIHGGNGADKMSGGTGSDADEFHYDATGETAAAPSAWTNTAAGSTVDVSSADIISGEVGDKINLTDIDGSGDTFTAVNETDTQVTTAASIGQSADVDYYTGNYDSTTGLFTSAADANASDILIIWDNNGDTTGTDYEMIVVTGISDVSNSSSVLTMA